MMIVYLIMPETAPKLFLRVMNAVAKPGHALGREVYPSTPKNMLKEKPFTGTEDERRLLMRLAMFEKAKSGMIEVPGRDAAAVLEETVLTGRAYWWSNTRSPIKWGKPHFSTPCWKVSDNGHFKTHFEMPAGWITITGAPPAFIDPVALEAAPLKSTLSNEAALRWQRQMWVSPEALLPFIATMQRDFPSSQLPSPVALSTRTISEEKPVPLLTLHTLPPSRYGLPSFLYLSVSFQYGEGRFTLAHHDPQHVLRWMDDKHTLVEQARNLDAEKMVLSLLEKKGFKAVDTKAGESLFDGQVGPDIYWLPSDGDLTWKQVLENVFLEWRTLGWRIESEKKQPLFAPEDNDWYTHVETGTRHHLQCEMGIMVDGKRVNLLPHIEELLREHRGKKLLHIEQVLKKGVFPIQTPDGLLLLPGERVFRIVRNVVELFSDQALDKENQRINVSTWRAAEMIRLQHGGLATGEISEGLHQLANLLEEGTTVQPLSAPASLKATLRPYQEMGLGWLDFLRRHQAGGILADDMGLGKTVQAIACLCHAKEQGALDTPALIVCPTSVLPNWKAELNRFAPHLRVICLNGTAKQRHEQLQEAHNADVIVTSYALLNRDQELLLDHTYAALIVDEAQHAKNPKTENSKTVRKVKARFRLALTGTPVENHLGELWAIFDLVMPGLLGSPTEFNRYWRNPIEKSGNLFAQNALKARVRPFMLRRTKTLVAKELPQKTTIIKSIPLSELQADYYEAVRIALSREIQEEISARGVEQAHIKMLAALMRLRQICCDPRLGSSGQSITRLEDSAKLATLADMIPELVEEGRRILVFSQFTEMMDLIMAELDRLGINYVELRGSTKDRETPVARFQAGEIPVFLISLKAGGTGLNLTRADVVIHYDPWWNQAVEDQATDRAHRIGQHQAVFVYKLVTEATIEARIVEIQERKRALVQSSLEEEGQIISELKLQAEDIRRLFAPQNEP